MLCEIFSVFCTDLAHPERHLVCVGGAMVKVEHHNTEDDRKGDQDHGEHKVVDDNGNAQRCFRDFVGQQKQEDS